jgi:hypothetical protein
MSSKRKAFGFFDLTAFVDVGQGKECFKVEKNSGNVTWTAHYIAGPAGRVLVHGLPDQFSCRVTLNGRELPVEIMGRSLTGNGGKGVGSENASVAVLYVDLAHRDDEGVELDYWRTTNDTTEFRDYIHDGQVKLIPGVQVRALRSGITATSDANGLFTIEVPASYRKGRFPSLATETLVFSKRGYRTLEYRDLVLNPSVNPLDIELKGGSGTVVRRNLSLRNNKQEVFTFKGLAAKCQTAMREKSSHSRSSLQFSTEDGFPASEARRRF